MKSFQEILKIKFLSDQLLKLKTHGKRSAEMMKGVEKKTMSSGNHKKPSSPWTSPWQWESGTAGAPSRPQLSQ